MSRLERLRVLLDLLEQKRDEAARMCAIAALKGWPRPTALYAELYGRMRDRRARVVIAFELEQMAEHARSEVERR